MKSGYIKLDHVQLLMATFELNPTTVGHTLSFLSRESGALSNSVVHQIMSNVAPEAFVEVTKGRFALSGVIPEGIHPDLHRPPLTLPTKKPRTDRNASWVWNADALNYLDQQMGTPTFRDLILTLDSKDLKELSIIGKTIVHAADEKLRTGDSSVPASPQSK